MIFPFVTQVFASDYPRHFVAVTDSTRPLCTEEALCYVSQSKDSRKYQILFDVFPSAGKSVVREVKIVSVEGKTTESYPLPSPKSVPQNDLAPLFVADINGDGFHDIVMQMGLGSKTGYMFHYWLYNPKLKKFSFTKDLIPALRPTNTDKIISLTTHSEYRADKNFQLIETKSK